MGQSNEKHVMSENELRDPELETALRGAYDAMNPTAEQEERMLAGLLEAQAAYQRAASPSATGSVAAIKIADASEAAAPGVAEVEPGVSAPAGAPGTAPELGVAPGSAVASEAAPGPSPSGNVGVQVVPPSDRKRSIKPWKVALPLAACLVVGAVMVGLVGQMAPHAGAPMLTPESAAPMAASGSDENAANASSGENKAYSVATPDGAASSQSVVGTAESAADADMAYEVAEPELCEPEPMPGPIDDFNTEEYSDLEERGFVSTKTSPLSTVSSDVDTASYCNLRRMINDGYALSDIPSGAVRIEEMLNYFDYDYAGPTGSDRFGMQAQCAPCPWNEDTQLLVMGFASSEEAKANDKGSNLVFLVDVSGSMNSPDKLGLLQDSFAMLTDELGPNDRVSIVTYANGESVVLEGAPGNDKAAIMGAIYRLQAGGSTNGEAGLKQAYEVAERYFIEGGVNRIVMASDGDLNVGMSSESELHDYVDKQRESGIYLSVLGFGSGNYKDNKMETLADHGNGSYHYIDCIEEAERVLRDKLTANLVPFADDVKVQVEFNPAQVKGYRLIGYDNRVMADEDFRDDTVDAGDVGPNSQFTVAYEIVLADSKMDVPTSDLKYGDSSGAATATDGEGANGDEWLTCTLRYHDFDADEVREQELVADASNVMSEPSDDWKFAAAVIEFGMIARDSKYAGTSSTDGVLDLLGTNLSDERDDFKRLVVRAS